MRLLDCSLKRPEDNLALDEAILDGLEAGNAPETLRFWESPTPFVVLGVSQAVREHVDQTACTADKIPILRRCSAGGCVLQGPGCLNFALTLSHEKHPQVRTIRESYCYILNAIGAAFDAHGLSVRHKGVSDLAVRGKKISGNAQKRRRGSILHHGSLLYNMDPEKMERYLRNPDDRPQYRGPRSHRGFVTNLPFSPEELRAIICQAFEVEGPREHPTRAEREAVATLVEEKYAEHSWNFRR